MSRHRVNDMTNEEMAEYIRQHPEMKYSDIKKTLHIGAVRLAEIRITYGICNDKPEIDEQYIIDNMGKQSAKEMARNLGCEWRRVAGIMVRHKKDGQQAGHVKSLMERAQRLAERLEHCTIDEYYDLAVQYSVLLNNIEAANLINSQSPKSKETKESCERIRNVHSLDMTTLLNQ